jgi:hypothetical protein
MNIEADKMDIEKLKKVNQLAVTLRQQGLAVGRDDAAKMASSMNLNYMDDDLNNIMNTVEKVNNKIVINDQEEEPNIEQFKIQKEVMDEEKVIKILQTFADQFVTEVNNLNEKILDQNKVINDLTSYVEHLKKQNSYFENSLKNMNNQNMSQSMNVMPQETITKPQQPIQENRNLNSFPKTEQKTSASPRSGNLNSNDVSIEKFFYFGNK